MTRSALLPALLAAAVLPATEVVCRDLHLAGELLPTEFAYAISDGTTTRSGTDRFQRAVGLRLGPRIAVADPGASLAWMGGIEARVGDSTYAGYGSYRTYGVGLTAGLGWACAERWQVSLEPVVGLGLARLACDANPAFAALQARGWHLAYGVRLGLSWTWRRTWVFGIDGGLLVTRSELTDGQERTMTIRQSGPVVALGIAWRWDHRPRALE